MDLQFLQLAAILEEENPRPRQRSRGPVTSLTTWIRRVIMRRRGNYLPLLEESHQYQWLEAELSDTEGDSELIFLTEVARSASSTESSASTPLHCMDLTLLDLPIPDDLPDPILPVIV
jgi:hypothetical protein